MAPLEDIDRRTYRKPDFMFGDAAPDPDHQLQEREGQWIFQLDDEKFYLPSNKRHFSLSSFPVSYTHLTLPTIYSV